MNTNAQVPPHLGAAREDRVVARARVIARIRPGERALLRSECGFDGRVHIDVDAFQFARADCAAVGQLTLDAGGGSIDTVQSCSKSREIA